MQTACQIHLDPYNRTNSPKTHSASGRERFSFDGLHDQTEAELPHVIKVYLTRGRVLAILTFLATLIELYDSPETNVLAAAVKLIVALLEPYE